MEGLKECEANLVVYLHPSKAKCAGDAILSELSSLLFTYNETFEGVVLAYDPNICSNLAKILPGIQPYFGVKLKARLLLFNPKPDMVVEGEVVKITPQSIHAVVLGFSSAFIADEDIRHDFKHKIKRGKEVYVSRTHKKHKIKVGTTLRFIVKSFDEEILHISGSLVADHTGCARWLDKNLDEWSQADSTIKKRKSGEGEHEKPRSDRLMVQREILSLENDGQVKKAKKKKKNIVES
ncbi:uncharacterized protein LOC105166018 [Sesamum indicum]|uniref:DNA-directed RNA polymerase subunit n=1 Tax=Sesamum indicum TaxID=4182 RepID=A0A6I9THG5_SESIN|nr:uncharacterized protein LOC105166018 [Sesamum indicum]